MKHSNLLLTFALIFMSNLLWANCQEAKRILESKPKIFTKAIIHLKHELKRRKSENPYIDDKLFVPMFAQLAEESGFGTSKGSKNFNNLGGWFIKGEGSGFRNFGSVNDFIDEWLDYVNSRFGRCVEHPSGLISQSSSSWKRYQSYMGCLQDDDQYRPNNNEMLYCASGCNEIYKIHKIASENQLNSRNKGYGTFKNMQYAQAIFDSSNSCGLDSQSSAGINNGTNIGTNSGKKLVTINANSCPESNPCRQGLTCFSVGVHATTTPGLSLECLPNGEWSELKSALTYTNNQCDDFYLQNNKYSCSAGEVVHSTSCEIKCYCQGSGSNLNYNCYDIRDGQQGVLYNLGSR